MGGDSATLTLGGYCRTVPYKSSNNLPILSSFPGCARYTAYSASLPSTGSLQETLTYPQRQLLRWHRRLGHIGCHKVQQFSRLGLLPKEIGTVCPDEFPVCAACQFGKQNSLTLNPLLDKTRFPLDTITQATVCLLT